MDHGCKLNLTACSSNINSFSSLLLLEKMAHQPGQLIKFTNTSFLLAEANTLVSRTCVNMLDIRQWTTGSMSSYIKIPNNDNNN